MNRIVPSAPGRHTAPNPWALAAAGAWFMLVPAACLLLGALLRSQHARDTALATEGARSEAELATALGRLGPTVTRAMPLDLPATWASAGEDTPGRPATTPAPSTPTARPSPSTTATPTPAPSVSPTVTAPVDLAQAPEATSTLSAGGGQVIGHSVAGRPITVAQFGAGPVVRLIVAGIHGGNEWNTIALADELMAHLAGDPSLVPEDVTLYVLRSLNPDGEARGTGIHARANDNNVDLNRNWPSRWQADWSRTGCWAHLRLSGGVEAGSEPETQALMQFMLEYRVDAVISYHSAALGIFAGGHPPDAASLSLAEAVAAVSDYPWPPLDFGCRYTGQLIDWASDQGIAALDVELTNHRDTDLTQNLRILEVFLNWRR